MSFLPKQYFLEREKILNNILFNFTNRTYFVCDSQQKQTCLRFFLFSLLRRKRSSAMSTKAVRKHPMSGAVYVLDTIVEKYQRKLC